MNNKNVAVKKPLTIVKKLLTNCFWQSIDLTIVKNVDFNQSKLL
jgi:hypothetical protein